MRNWKKLNPTARPSLQVTMKAASQPFSHGVGFMPIWPILSKCVQGL